MAGDSKTTHNSGPPPNWIWLSDGVLNSDDLRDCDACYLVSSYQFHEATLIPEECWEEEVVVVVASFLPAPYTSPWRNYGVVVVDYWLGVVNDAGVVGTAYTAAVVMADTESDWGGADTRQQHHQHCRRQHLEHCCPNDDEDDEDRMVE